MFKIIPGVNAQLDSVATTAKPMMKTALQAHVSTVELAWTGSTTTPASAKMDSQAPIARQPSLLATTIPAPTEEDAFHTRTHSAASVRRA